MNRRRPMGVFNAAAFGVLLSAAREQPARGMSWWRAAADPFQEDDAECGAMATTGRASARRGCAGGRNEAHVDNRVTIHVIQRSPRFRELPIDRLRARGKGRIHAAGDKGAKRELREKRRRRH